MKYKINDRFWCDIKKYLDENKIIYKWKQQSQKQYGILQIDSNNNWGSNHEHFIAEKLLSEFYKSKILDNQITVIQWIKNYQKKLSEIITDQEILCNSLNNDLLKIKYNQLKKKIIRKKKVLAQQITRNLQAKQKYSLSSQIEDKKIKAGIENIEYRIQLVCQKQQQQDEQLARVKNLIKNGMWGMLSQVESKLQQISTLQNQIKELLDKKQQQ